MGKNNKEKQSIDAEINDIKRTLFDFYAVDNDEEMSRNFNDKFSTEQQKSRDVQISKLLKMYVKAYNAKTKSNRLYKNIIFWFCMIVLSAFSVCFLIFICKYSGSTSTLKINNVVALITASVTYLTLIIGILKIITEYVFPQKEEEYITKIVETIQKNDLENKKANIESSK